MHIASPGTSGTVILLAFALLSTSCASLTPPLRQEILKVVAERMKLYKLPMNFVRCGGR